jgi:hypothetical protein
MQRTRRCSHFYGASELWPPNFQMKPGLADQSSEVGQCLQIQSTWPKNRLSGKVIVANRLVTAFSMSAKSPRHSPTARRCEVSHLLGLLEVRFVLAS